MITSCRQRRAAFVGIDSYNHLFGLTEIPYFKYLENTHLWATHLMLKYFARLYAARLRWGYQPVGVPRSSAHLVSAAASPLACFAAFGGTAQQDK